MTSGSTTTTYSYDGLDKRLQASTGSQASKKTNYAWDVNAGLPQLVLERDGNNGLLRRYVNGHRAISMTTGNKIYYFHYDPLGSVVNLTSSTGATEWTDSYEPSGPIRTEVKNDTKAPATLMKYTGQYLDPTGLYHLRARQYDPSTGRFTTQDPLPNPVADAYVSAYAYANDAPTVLVDPSGLRAGTCGSIRCFTGYVGRKAVCMVKKHPIEVGLAVVFAAATAGTVGVAGAALLGYLPEAGVLGGLATTEGGLHATATLIAGGAVLGGGTAAAGYAASERC